MTREILIFMLLFLSTLCPQVKFMSYNLLNYPGNDTITRNPYFRIIVKSVEPDILVAQEITSEVGVNGFLKNVLNSVFPNTYSSSVFNDGPDSDNNVYFKTGKFSFLSNIPIRTEVRNINQFRLKFVETGDTLIIYSVHLKAGSTSVNVTSRGKEVDSLRKVTSKLHAGANYLVCGDFNIYNSNEPAYQKLLDKSKPGYFIDDIVMTGAWNKVEYAKYHTQSPRVRQFGGGSHGGMDDRFDMILFSEALKIPGGIDYTEGSLFAYGNDGLHFNDSLNRPPNLVVSQEIANAIHYASDHLPVVAEFQFDKPLPVELVSFTAKTLYEKNSVLLNWTTASELNNQGFEIERKHNNSGNWVLLGDVQGKGTSSILNQYNFADNTITESGLYFYRLKQVDFSGTSSYSHEVEINFTNMKNTQLLSSSTFGNQSELRLYLPYDQHLRIAVYNILGEQIELIVDGFTSQGTYNYKWTSPSSGVFFYFIQSEFLNKAIKVIMIK